ncbi:MAG: hypothetical protein WCK92_06550 [Bacteroidota bacterium]
MNRIIFHWFCLFFCVLCGSINAQNFDSLQNIRIIVTFSSAPASYAVVKAPLRFNKLFAFSLEEDDGEKDIYTHAYPFLNGGTIAGVIYPGLKYTDGCGNDQKFKMSGSIFPFISLGPVLVDCHDPATSYSTLNVTWPQLSEMYRQNWGVLDHGLTSGGGGTPAYEVARNTSYMKLKLPDATPGGPDEKIFVNPNGGDIYSPDAWAQGYTICYREGYSFADHSFNVSGPFPHQDIGMHRTNSYEAYNLSNLVDNFANGSTAGAHQWGVAFTHSVTNSNYGYSFATFQNHMNYIADTYGKNGLDNILMTTEEEIIDYLLVRDSIMVNTQLSGNILTVSFTGSVSDKYRFYNSTLLISSDQNIASIAVQGVQTSSSTGAGLASGMVNISWNGHHVVPPEVNAETWVSKTESSHSQEDANVAMDYVLMVPPGPAQRNFRIRLCQVTGLTLPSEFCAYRNAPVCTIPELGGCPGHTLVLPVLIDSCFNITGCYQRIEYDPAIMTFVSGIAGKPNILSGMGITDQAVGGSSSLRKVLVSWTGAAAKSLSVHDTLVKLTFSYISGNANVAFNISSNSGTDCKYLDEGGNTMYQYPPSDYYFNGGVTNARLAAPGAISGPSTLCPGATGNMYAVSPVTGATSYQWDFPSGFTITHGDGSDTVFATAGPNAVSGNITVRAVNVCNDNPLSPAFTVTMKSRPVPVINGTSDTCAMSAGLPYSTENGMMDYIWSVSAGGQIISGMGTSNITVDWDVAGSQNVNLLYRATNGCMAPLPTVKTVTVNPRPLPLITGPDTVCRTLSASFSTNPGNQLYQWQVSPGGTIESGGSTSVINVRWNNEGPQWIRLNYSNTYGCQALAPVVKNIFVCPIAQPVLAGPDSLCEGASEILYTTTAGMVGYSWSLLSGGTITSGAGTSSIHINWNAPGIHQLKLNYTYPGGCAAAVPFILPVHVHPRPLPHIIGPGSLCKGSTMLFYTESGMSNYQWTISPGGIILSGAVKDSIITSWTTAGNQDVTVTYKNIYGCPPVNPVSHDILVHPLPQPSIGGPSSACNGSVDKIYTTQAGMTNYSWSISSGGMITSGLGKDTIHVNWYSPGIKQITVNYLDPNLCTSPNPASSSTTVNPLPVPTITGPSAACAGSTVVYSTQAAMNGYSWSISPGGSIVSGQGTQTLNVKWNQPGPEMVSVNYSNSYGCFAINPVVMNVTVNPSPAPSITGPGSLCLNSQATYFTETGMSTYSWTVSAGGSIISGNGSPLIHVNWNGSGDQSVSLSGTNTYGCITAQPVQKQIRIHPLPAPVINGPATLCCYSTNQVYVTQHGKSSYHWTITNGGLITHGQGSDSIRVTWNIAGLQQLTVTYADSNGCVPTLPGSYQVNVNQLPVPSITGPAAVCEGVTGNTYSTQDGMGGYLWNIPSGGTILSGLGTSVIHVLWNSAGARSVSINYSNSNGCYAQAPFVKNVTVYPLPVPIITGPDSLCMNATGVYTTESGMHNYQWVISPGGSNITGLGTNTISVTWTTAGPRTISVNYMNDNNCMAASPSVFGVTIFPLPAPTISGPTTVCANSSSEVYFTESGMSDYTWVVSSGGLIASGQGTRSILVNWATPGNATVSVTCTSHRGCHPASPAIINVLINPRPVPGISGNNIVCLNSGPKSYFTEDGKQNYHWATSAVDTILNGQGTPSVTVQWANAGNRWISIIYSEPSGCEAIEPVTLHVIVTPDPGPSSAISGPSVLCAPASWQEYTVLPVPDASGYYWTLPSGAVFQGSPNSNIIHLSYLPNAQSGNIAVYGTNACGNGTPSSLPVTINPVPPQPGVTMGPNNTLLSSSINGNQWYLNSQPLPGDTLNHLQVTLTGNYFTIVTLDNCVSDTSNIKYVIAVGMPENYESAVKVHPNPTKGPIILDFINPVERVYHVYLLNELGQKIYRSERTIPGGESSWMINISEVPRGPVILVIQSAENIVRKKIIKD